MVEEEVLVYTFFHDLKEAYKVYGFFKDNEVYADRVVVKTVWHRLFQVVEKYLIGIVLDRNDYGGIEKVKTLFKENFNIKASVDMLNYPEEVRKMGNEVKVNDVEIKEFENQLKGVVKELEDIKNSLDKINTAIENLPNSCTEGSMLGFYTKDLVYDVKRMATYWSSAFHRDAVELKKLCEEFKKGNLVKGE